MEEKMLNLKKENYEQGMPKLTEDDVIAIFKKLQEGYSGKELAYEYKVTDATISYIKNRRRWKSVIDANFGGRKE
jgi:response regulator of citrate/malate metabolism